jgi:hypothetical protein
LTDDALSPRQRLGVQLLASGSTPTRVSAFLGIDPSLVRRWKTQNWRFRRALRETESTGVSPALIMDSAASMLDRILGLDSSVEREER